MKMVLLSVLVSLIGIVVLVFSTVSKTPSSEIKALDEAVVQLESDNTLIKSLQPRSLSMNQQCDECSQLSDRVKRLRKKLAVLEGKLASESERSTSCLSSLVGEGFSVSERLLTIAGLIITFLGMIPAWFALAVRH